MFDARARAVLLQAVDVGRGHGAAVEGVFGVAFKVAPGVGGAVDVDGGSEQDVRAFGLDFLGQQFADFLNQFGVPGCAEGRAAGRTGRGGAGAASRAARAVWSVGDFDDRDSEPLYRDGVPHIGSGQQADFFFKGHLGNQLFDFVAHVWLSLG